MIEERINQLILDAFKKFNNFEKNLCIWGITQHERVDEGLMDYFLTFFTDDEIDETVNGKKRVNVKKQWKRFRDNKRGQFDYSEDMLLYWKFKKVDENDISELKDYFEDWIGRQLIVNVYRWFYFIGITN